MPSVECLALDIVCPCVPQGERTADVFVPSAERSPTTPKHKNWTGDAAPRLAVLTIMFMVNRCGRAALFADCMYMSGITQRFDIGLPNLRAEDVRSRAPGTARMIDDGLGSS
jgi:hypothetical protein